MRSKSGVSTGSSCGRVAFPGVATPTSPSTAWRLAQRKGPSIEPPQDRRRRYKPCTSAWEESTYHRGMASAPEYCPVSIGVAVVSERWNLLILRELLGGPRGFNDIHRGLPGLSRT